MTLPDIETLTSSRLRVRPVCEQDLSDLLAVNADPQVTQYLPYASWTSWADARAWLDRMNALAAGGTGRQLVIVKTRPTQVIGSVLLFRYEEGSNRLELGYVLGRPHWGHGYATEALRLLLNHLFHHAGIRRVEAEVNPDNQASSAVLRRLGFTHEGRLRERWTAKGRSYDTDMHGLLAHEWPENPDDPTARPSP